MRVLILAFLKGISPIMAVEIGRRAIPDHVRPSFQEVEQIWRGGGAAAAGGEPSV
jgi:chemotaxis protein MotA